MSISNIRALANLYVMIVLPQLRTCQWVDYDPIMPSMPPLPPPQWFKLVLVGRARQVAIDGSTGRARGGVGKWSYLIPCADFGGSMK